MSLKGKIKIKFCSSPLFFLGWGGGNMFKEFLQMPETVNHTKPYVCFFFFFGLPYTNISMIKFHFKIKYKRSTTTSIKIEQLYAFNNPLPREQGTAGLNAEFSFSWTGRHTKGKELSPPLLIYS